MRGAGFFILIPSIMSFVKKLARSWGSQAEVTAGLADALENPSIVRVDTGTDNDL